MRNIGTTEIVTHPSDPAKEYAVLKIGGGAEAGRVYSTLEGTGWAFLGPRAGSIGVGGFLLGGGIAFQTNRYGVANDNLLGLEVVLINGTIIYANPYNEYNDLFWAATGGGWLASFGEWQLQTVAGGPCIVTDTGLNRSGDSLFYASVSGPGRRVRRNSDLGRRAH